MANGKVFCCGGDLTSAYTFINLGHWSFGASYYRKEFYLDYFLATYKKPLLALLDGSVMGGGVGISIHSTFRIVTENTSFAMPEVLIGLFPDVGASYFLSRLPGFFGEYVGLTGARLNGAEMLACGLGTHFVPSKVLASIRIIVHIFPRCMLISYGCYLCLQNLKPLENALENMVASLGSPSVASLSMIINKFAQEVNVKSDSIYLRLDMINQCFNGKSCEEILSSLEHLATQVQEKWVHDAIKSMKSANPLGLKICLRMIREGRSRNIEQCLETEYIAISHVLRRTFSNNFYEVSGKKNFSIVHRPIRLISLKKMFFLQGSRAMLIDKDKKPKWVPSTLEGVSEEMVARCLSESFNEDDDWLPLQLSLKTNRTDAVASKL
ncbi:putative 3-hydroxyisobutyryl-CoA hydrolase [Helianthus anomalus]